MDLETSRTLGGIGAILMFIMPFLGAYTAILGLIGLILVLIGLKGLADNYKEQGIFNNALYGIIAAIIGCVVFAAILIVGTVGLFTRLGIDMANWMDWAMFQRIDWATITDFTIFWDFAIAILAGIVILFVLFIIAAIFLRKSLNLLSAKSGVGLFGTTGLLILIGAVLTIIAIGLLLIWIAFILLAVAFFSIRPRAAEPATPTPPPQQ
ncbi:DUF996 domain-containing protein [Candidatus Bathyarchaeota archaeon]|nr:DUF996 domain-containing protein [Candidatus Bathyarchaeota archaeon]